MDPMILNRLFNHCNGLAENGGKLSGSERCFRRCFTRVDGIEVDVEFFFTRHELKNVERVVLSDIRVSFSPGSLHGAEEKWQVFPVSVMSYSIFGLGSYHDLQSHRSTTITTFRERPLY